MMRVEHKYSCTHAHLAQTHLVQEVGLAPTPQHTADALLYARTIAMDKLLNRTNNTC